MATAYKVLGQVAPSATTATAIYTVPSATSAVVSSIIVCNRAAVDDQFRLMVRPNGATLANEHYIIYDNTCASNDSLILTIGLTLGANDVLEAYATSADFTFSAYGSEIS